MKLYTLPNGAQIRAGDQFEIGDQKYPGGWLATATDDELAALSIAINVVDDPPSPPEPVPDISRRQFFQQLPILGVITEDEALAAMGGAIPAALAALVAALPEDGRFSAKMLLTGASTFQRDHAVTREFAAAYQWSDAQVDQFFAAAARL